LRTKIRAWPLGPDTTRRANGKGYLVSAAKSQSLHATRLRQASASTLHVHALKVKWHRSNAVLFWLRRKEELAVKFGFVATSRLTSRSHDTQHCGEDLGRRKHICHCELEREL